MKERKLYVLLFTLCLPLFLFSQNDSQPSSGERALTPAENLAVQQGELENFRYMLLRLDNALQDKDQESVNVLKQALTDIMKNELNQTVTTSSEKAQSRLKRQREIYDTLSRATFTVEEGWIEKSKSGMEMFDEFARLMEEEVAALEKEK